MKETLALYVNGLRKNFAAYCDSRLKEYNLTDGLFYYLIYAGKHSECSPGEIARELKADNGHTSRCINKLENLGYLIRTNNPDDKRNYAMSLTEEGRKIFSEIYSLFDDWDTIVCKDLNESQKQELLKLLQIVGNSAKEEMECMKF